MYDIAPLWADCLSSCAQYWSTHMPTGFGFLENSGRASWGPVHHPPARIVIDLQNLGSSSIFSFSLQNFGSSSIFSFSLVQHTWSPCLMEFAIGGFNYVHNLSHLPIWAYAGGVLDFEILHPATFHRNSGLKTELAEINLGKLCSSSVSSFSSFP